MLLALAVATLPKYVEWFDELIFTVAVFCTAVQVGIMISETREGTCTAGRLRTEHGTGYRKDLAEDLMREVRKAEGDKNPRYFLLLHPTASSATHSGNAKDLLEAAATLRLQLAQAEVCACMVHSRKDGDCIEGKLRLSASVCDRVYSYLLSLIPGRNEAVLVSAIGGVEIGRWWGGKEIVEAAVRGASRVGEERE